MYSEGNYFKDISRHSEDSTYKASTIKKILFKYLTDNKIAITSYADVGCGSGDIVKILGRELKQEFNSLQIIKGFDVSPHVEELNDDLVEFSFGDFTEINEKFDLVTLNDVFEHVPNPITFLNKIGKASKLVVMHIPLDNCLSVNLRSLQKRKLKNPGHLVYLDINSYSKEAIKAASNNKTILQKITYPFKAIFLKINPYLYSKIFGMSIVVIAEGID